MLVLQLVLLAHLVLHNAQLLMELLPDLLALQVISYSKIQPILLLTVLVVVLTLHHAHLLQLLSILHLLHANLVMVYKQLQMVLQAVSYAEATLPHALLLQIIQ
jgi:hypothetical protein